MRCLKSQRNFQLCSQQVLKIAAAPVTQSRMVFDNHSLKMSHAIRNDGDAPRVHFMFDVLEAR